MSAEPMPLIFIGAGGHAAVLREIAQFLGHPILGYVAQIKSDYLADLPHLGDDPWLKQRKMLAHVQLVNAIGSVHVEGNLKRSRIFEDYKAMGYSFASMLHPMAIISPEARLGEGLQVMAGAILQPGCTLGSNVIINTGAVVEHHCVIEADAHIAPRATLCGGCQVGGESFIGAGAICVQGAIIPPQTMVKAGQLISV